MVTESSGAASGLTRTLPSTSRDKLAYVLFGCILLSLVPIGISGMKPGFADTPWYAGAIVSSFCLEAALVFCYTARKRIVIRRDVFVISLLTVVAPTATLASIVLRGGNPTAYDWIYPFMRLASVTVFLVAPSQYCLTPKALRAFMKCMVVLGIFGCVFNIVLYHEHMMRVASIINPYAVTFRSFYPGRNLFAQLLMWCTIANTFLVIQKLERLAKLVYWFNYVLLGANLLLTFSRSSLISTTLFLLLIAFLCGRGKPTTQVILMLLVVCVVLWSVSQAPDSFLYRIILRPGMGLTSRPAIWKTGVGLLGDYGWLFGVGYGTSTQVLEDMGYPNEYHSFFISTLVGGGVMDLLVHGLVFLFLGRTIYRIYRADRMTGLVYLLAYVALTAKAMVESASFFAITYSGTLLTIFLVSVPVLYSNYHRWNERFSDRVP